MAEYRPGTEQFIRDFNALYAAAEAGPGHYGLVRPPGQSHHFEVWRQRGSAATNPYLAEHDVTSLTQPPTHRVDDRSRAPDLHLLSAEGLVRRFSGIAPSGQGLAVVARAYADWLPKEKRRNGQDIAAVFGRLLFRSTLINPSPYDESPNTFVDALAELRGNPFEGSARNAISKWLGTVLLREHLGGHPPHVYHAMVLVPHRRLIQALEAIDAIDMVRPDFWLAYGIAAGAAFRHDDVLQGLNRRLTPVEGQRAVMLEQVPGEKLQALTASYIDNILETYPTDKHRNKEMLLQIREVTATERSKRPGAPRTVDLQRFIQLSNGLARGLNERLQAAGGDAAGVELPILASNNLRNVPDALARVLYMTVRPGVSDEALARMFERDMTHADNLELIRLHVREQNGDHNEADIRLRHPDAPDEAIGQMHRALRESDARQQIHAYGRAKRATEGTVAMHSIKRRGYGLLS